MGNQLSSDVVVTTEIDAFVKALLPGDILVFDNMHWLSNLIKFADNSPTSHSAVVLPGNDLVDAGEGEVAVLRTEITEYLNARHHTQAIQAVRPNSLAPDAGTKLAEAVRQFEDTKHKFATMDLAWLAPAALRRSYGALLIPGEPHDLAEIGNPRVLRMLYRALEVACKLAGGKVGDDEFSLTCSEFVFRLFRAAGIELAIDHPLTFKKGESTAGDDGPWTDLDIANELARIETRRELNKRVYPDLADQVDATAGVQPDLVTPADLFRSSSVRPVAVLVRSGPLPL